MKVLYFGCHREAGHYLWEPEMRNAGWMTFDLIPWGKRLDTGLCPPTGQIEGQAALHVRDGWTALAFWDRSVDRRSNSNSAFLAEGEHTFEEMLVLARENFPEVMGCFHFEIRLSELPR